MISGEQTSFLDKTKKVGLFIAESAFLGVVLTSGGIWLNDYRLNTEQQQNVRPNQELAAEIRNVEDPKTIFSEIAVGGVGMVLLMTGIGLTCDLGIDNMTSEDL